MSPSLPVGPSERDIRTPDEPDYYETLHVSPGAKPRVIDNAYKNLARKYHPDVNPNSDAHQRMAELNRAMEVLRDPRKRAEYDRRRIRFLAQRALAARSPASIFWMFRQASYSIRLRESLRRLSLPWLAFVGGLIIALVGMAMTVTQYMRDSGVDRPSSTEFRERLVLDRPDDPFRADGVQPGASPPAQAGVPLPATPTPTASASPTASLPPQALSAVLDESRPGVSSSSPATATPTPAAATVPTPGPDTAPATTPSPATPAPQTPAPTPSPAQCSAGGAPQLTENGNQVSFTDGAVVSFDAGPPGVLVADVAGTALQLAITSATVVQGDLDSATIVSGQGRRLKDGTITAQLVEVVCQA